MDPSSRLSVLALKAHDRDEEGQQRLGSSTLWSVRTSGSDSRLLWDLPEEEAVPPHGDDATAWRLWHAARDQRQGSGSGSRSIDVDSGDACSDWSASADRSAEPNPVPPQTRGGPKPPGASPAAWDPCTSARPESRRSYSPAGSGRSLPRSGASGIICASALPREPRRARASMDQISLDLDLLLGLDSGAPGDLVDLPSNDEPRDEEFSLGEEASTFGTTSVPSMMETLLSGVLMSPTTSPTQAHVLDGMPSARVGEVATVEPTPKQLLLHTHTWRANGGGHPMHTAPLVTHKHDYAAICVGTTFVTLLHIPHRLSRAPMSAVDMAVAFARFARVPPARDDGASLLLDLLPDLTHADTTPETTGLTSRTGSLPDLSLTPLRPYQTKPLSRRHPPEPDDPGPASPLTPAATRTQKRARYLGPPPPPPAALSLFTEVLQDRVLILNMHVYTYATCKCIVRICICLVAAA